MNLDLSGWDQRQAQWRLKQHRIRAQWCLWLTVGMMLVLAGCAWYVVNHLEVFLP